MRRLGRAGSLEDQAMGLADAVPALVNEREGFLSNIRGSGLVPGLGEEASD